MAEKKKVRVGNWTPDGKLERARLREDYEQLTLGERVEQVIDLSRTITRLAAGAKARS